MTGQDHNCSTRLAWSLSQTRWSLSDMQVQQKGAEKTLWGKGRAPRVARFTASAQ